MSKYINIPVVLQMLGVLVFGLSIWKGVHGALVTFGLIAGVLMLYIGRHYATVYNETVKTFQDISNSH